MPVCIDRYVVMGHPVAHSKSPAIHALFARQTGQSLEYGLLEAPLDGFSVSARAFFAEGGQGCNVTIPFKREAWELADERSTYAERAGALNTLLRRADGSLYGHNTDGLGLLRDLQINHGVMIAGKRVLVLGAGGAVRGILQPLLEENPESVFIANRTAATAEGLAADFAGMGNMDGGGFERVRGRYDLVINGTSTSLQGEVPPLSGDCLQADAVCYDMMYAAEPTAFVRWGQERGAGLSLDGLGMLVEQAAEAFLLWRGVRPDTQPVLDALRG